MIFFRGLNDEKSHRISKGEVNCYCQAKFPTLWQTKFPTFSPKL